MLPTGPVIAGISVASALPWSASEAQVRQIRLLSGSPLIAGEVADGGVGDREHVARGGGADRADHVILGGRPGERARRHRRVGADRHVAQHHADLPLIGLDDLFHGHARAVGHLGVFVAGHAGEAEHAGDHHRVGIVRIAAAGDELGAQPLVGHLRDAQVIGGAERTAAVDAAHAVRIRGALVEVQDCRAAGQRQREREPERLTPHQKRPPARTPPPVGPAHGVNATFFSDASGRKPRQRK
jgi:hypothetical protein